MQRRYARARDSDATRGAQACSNVACEVLRLLPSHRACTPTFLLRGGGLPRDWRGWIPSRDRIGKKTYLSRKIASVRPAARAVRRGHQMLLRRREQAQQQRAECAAPPCGRTPRDSDPGEEGEDRERGDGAAHRHLVAGAGEAERQDAQQRDRRRTQRAGPVPRSPDQSRSTPRAAHLINAAGRMTIPPHDPVARQLRQLHLQSLSLPR